LAIPGSIHSPQSHGCHALIRQGAKLVETAQDVLEELQLMTPLHTHLLTEAPGPANGNPMPKDEAQDALLALMGFAPVSLDALQARCDLDTASLQAQLFTMELNAHVARLPGGLFQRLKGG
jgi:DNA processing protein